jgi:SAM-dependent methyltransferase
MSKLEQGPPAWWLPDGVDGALWSYAAETSLAKEDATYFADHSLCVHDIAIVGQQFAAAGRLVDLGCGSGRALLEFAGRGFSVVGVDLSQSMLEAARSNALRLGVGAGLVRGNLCRLGFLPQGYFDYALLLFSTLGMVRGRASRRRALVEAAGIVRAGGWLAIHAHNVLNNRKSLSSLVWLLGDSARWVARRANAGDRPMTYRGIRNLVVHQYRWGELKSDLSAAGWRVAEVVPLDAVDAGRTVSGPFAKLRAGGWLVFAQRKAAKSS